MLDAIVISDLHLGSSVCKHEKLKKFLENLPETKRLILNGDVLDSTAARLKRHHWQILSLLRKLSDEVELVWVAGNHDSDAESVAHLVGAVWCREEYAFASSSHRIVCTHGDQFDDFIGNYPRFTKIVDWLYRRLQWLSPAIAITAKRGSKMFARNCEKIQKSALQLADSSVSAVICGHTHKGHSGLFYSNSGSWTSEICEFITVENGKVSLSKY